MTASSLHLYHFFATIRGISPSLLIPITRLPRWGGPKRENRKERDGTSECYRWLAKCDLMTKTGYGYAKCLTVAGTATSAPLQEMFVLEHSETTVQQNRSKKRKDGKKKRNKRGYLVEKIVV